jgi:hypothetical protein
LGIGCNRIDVFHQIWMDANDVDLLGVVYFGFNV